MLFERSFCRFPALTYPDGTRAWDEVQCLLFHNGLSECTCSFPQLLGSSTVHFVCDHTHLSSKSRDAARLRAVYSLEIQRAYRRLGSTCVICVPRRCQCFFMKRMSDGLGSTVSSTLSGEEHDVWAGTLRGTDGLQR